MHLAHAIINLTDNLGTFQLDKVVASSPTNRRASTLSLPEIVHACTESLRLLLLGGDESCEDSSNHSLHRRQIGNTPHRRIEAAAAAATDPASFLEDVAAEASSGLEEGGGALRDAHRRLRVKRAVCKATIDALFLRRPSAAGQLLTTKPGSLVALPSPEATAAEAAPMPPRRFPRRVRFAPLASSDGATATSEAEHLAEPPAAATLLDTCPPPPPRPFPRRVAFTPVAISDGAATSEAQHLEESPAARLLDTCPPPARGELFADEEDAKNLRSLADSHMARKVGCWWLVKVPRCQKEANGGMFRLPQTLRGIRARSRKGWFK